MPSTGDLPYSFCKRYGVIAVPSASIGKIKLTLKNGAAADVITEAQRVLGMVDEIEFESDIALKDCIERLSALDNMIIKNTPANPISDCKQSFNCVLSLLEQSSDQSSSLRFWMVADPLRYGIANNYVNVSDFLLKSYL